MNEAMYLVRKKYLFSLMRKVSEKYGGDDADWLKRCFDEVVESHPDEIIEVAISCYKGLV